MKTAILAVLLVVAFTEALPLKSNIYIDVYKNIVNNQVSRVYKGKEASYGQFPHQAVIRWGIFGIFTFICGGSVISKFDILTAAHCKAYDFGTYDVVLGQLIQGDENAQIYKVKEFNIHPGYPGGNEVAANDIGIIQLASAIEFTETIQSIKVETDNCNVSEKELYISGFGQTSIIPIPPKHLKYDKVKGISNEECAEDLIELIGEKGPLDNTMVCSSSYHDKYQGVCAGDSGGPLALNGVVVGVVSWGISPCGTAGAPSVYTNVCAHVDYIKDHTHD